MTFSTILSLVLLSLGISSVLSHEGCGVPERDNLKTLEIQEREKQLMMRRDFSTELFSRADPIRVPIDWHVVYVQGQDGKLTQSQLELGVTELNRWYTPSVNVQFYTASIQYIDATNDPDTFNLKVYYNADATLRTKNHVGNSRHLNIYTANLQGGLGGVSTFPDDYTYAPTMDGVVLLWNVLGQTFDEQAYAYSWRVIIAHEVGHWLGLYHTFQGGCSDTAGDLVADTPASAKGNDYCDVPVDSCPQLPGNDPTDNLMDYCGGECRQVITPGQVQRIKNQFALYRNYPIDSTATTAAPTTGRVTTGVVVQSTTTSAPVGSTTAARATTSAVGTTSVVGTTTGRVLSQTTAAATQTTSRVQSTTAAPVQSTSSAPVTTAPFVACEGSCSPGFVCVNGACVSNAGVINFEDGDNAADSAASPLKASTVFSTIAISFAIYFVL